MDNDAYHYLFVGRRGSVNIDILSMSNDASIVETAGYIFIFTNNDEYATWLVVGGMKKPSYSELSIINKITMAKAQRHTIKRLYEESRSFNAWAIGQIERKKMMGTRMVFDLDTVFDYALVLESNALENLDVIDRVYQADIAIENNARFLAHTLYGFTTKPMVHSAYNRIQFEYGERFLSELEKDEEAILWFSKIKAKPDSMFNLFEMKRPEFLIYRAVKK